MTITYRKMKLEEADKIGEINPYYYIKNAWRTHEGQLKLIEIDYEDRDWANGYDQHLKGLISTIENDGFACGAFDEAGKLVGFVTLDSKVYEYSSTYVLLDQLFINLDHRGMGIGKELFNRCVQEARAWGVDKIYICAGSAEDTIAFYNRVGCIQASEINQALYEEDPRDLQLEYQL